MKRPRAPAAFTIGDGTGPDALERRSGSDRKPAAIRDLEEVNVLVSEIDAFEAEASAGTGVQDVAMSRRRRPGWGSIFLSALGILVALALGLWAEGLVRDLFARSPWLGSVAAAATGVASLALVVLLAREALALARLGSVARLQRDASAALAGNDLSRARAVVARLVQHVGSNPSTASGRQVLAGLQDDVIDGADLIRIAEREIFAGLDREARRIVMDSAKRVSVVTAVSPRALIDVAFVLFEAGRLVRRLSQHYGARPGALGFVRLVRDVIGHLAITGSIAIGDSLVQQLIGHGLAARLSARLGEGVINGLMTVRIGIAAIETVRPLPFSAIRRPSMGDFLPGLTGSANVTGRNKP